LANGVSAALEDSALRARRTGGITLHGLATSAAKYGALSVPNGQISLTWTYNADGRLVLHWTETGGPAVKIPTQRGFGTRIIERVIGQLRGKARFDWHVEGLVCEIILQA
jgi:two-component sensor histidine kinase